MTTPTILAVDAGTREFGVALFRGEWLADCSVKSLRRSRPQQTRLQVLERVFTDLLAQENVDAVVISEQPSASTPSDRSPAQIVRGMQAIARERGVTTHLVAPTEVKLAVTGYATATKRMIARAVCARYPHLDARLPKLGTWRERYALRMFSAVATGLAYCRSTHPDSHTDHATA